MGFIMVYENLDSYSAVSSEISEKLLEVAVENGDLSSNITLGSTTAEVRDVLVLSSPHCFVGQSPEGAWYSKSTRHQMAPDKLSLFQHLVKETPSQWHSCQVKPVEGSGKGKQVETFMGNNSPKQLTNNVTVFFFSVWLHDSFLGLWETVRLRDLNIKCSRHHSAKWSITETNGSRTVLQKQESFPSSSVLLT